MSKLNMLNGFLSLARAWPLCLASAAIAYLTIAGLLFLLAPDIAGLIVTGALTAKLVLTLVIAFVFLNVLLVLTYAASLFIIKHVGIAEGFKRNGGKLVKGFAFLFISTIACLAVITLVGYNAVSTMILSQDSFKLMAMNYGTGIVVSFLFAFPLVWLVTSLAGERFWIGLGRFLSVVALVLLMLIILSIYGFPGLFTDSLLIPTVVSLVIRTDRGKAEDNGFSLFKGRSMRKTITAVILTILILSAEAPFNSMLFAFGEEARFNESRLRDIVSRAVAEGWGSGELADAIKSDPELSMLSTYDLSGIAIERDDAGNVEVTIPLNAAGYRVYRKASNRTTVYDVYLQSGRSEATVGDKRYVLAGYETMVETHGPFETLEDALARESEVKKHANSTRVTWNTTLKTESREATRVETRYAIVPTVRVVKYDVKGEFDTYEAAQNHLFCYPGMLGVAEIREVEKKVWVYSYRLEFERETRDRHEAMMVARDENDYMVEEVRENVTILVFEMLLVVTGVPTGYMGTVEIEKNMFERMVRDGELSKGFDARGEYYYYASQDPCVRLYRTGEKNREGEVVAWRICRKIDTSHYETRKTYQVAIPNGYEERKISIGELPSYAKGFPSKGDAESSRQSVENMLKNWVNNQSMMYKSCEIESYEEKVTRTETVIREVKQYYVTATFLKPIYDIYELQSYYKVWNETRYEDRWGWVFKGYVNKTPETYDTALWVYSPEVLNWTSKTYLGIVTEWEAQALMSIDPRYVAEKHNTTTVTKEVAYYDVYNATWRLLYRYYKYVVQPLHNYIANGNVSSGGGWAFESLGEASGEICSLTYRSSPSSLRITSKNGRGAWRQTFYFNAGGSSPVLDFWYILRGSGAVAVKKPDGSAYVFTLGGSSSWSRFSRDSGDVFNQAGYYTISFVASENSELLVDDVSVHVGGYGEWVYQGDVENKPENVPSDEKYEAFYKIENKKFIGTFEESIANQYPTPPYIKEFKKRERVSYIVDLYKLYYLEGGIVRYRVFHWEKYEVPIVVRKEETGASWTLVESNVEMDVGQRILVDSNVPESIVRAKYNDPTKYYLVPKVVDSGEALELVCETLDESLAKKYGEEGYVVKSARVSAGNPIRFSMRVLQASVEKNELGMLGKQNFLHVAIANPTRDTLAYQVVIEAENNRVVEETLLDYQPHMPEAVRRIIMVPIAEPDSWLLVVPPGGAPYQLAFTTWVRRTEEREYGSYSANVAHWPGGQVTCNFMVKILRNGRLVAKQRILETFENFDVGRTIARHPFEMIGGFLVGFSTATVLTALSLAFPGVGTAIAIAGLALSSINAISVYAQTGSITEALTYSPLGIVVAPVRALTDPTMDDSARASIMGAMIGIPLGAFVGRQIALDVAMLRMPSELRGDPAIYTKLYGIESNYGTPIASAIARSIGRLYPHLDVPDAKGLVNMILSDALASRQDALYIASMLEWASKMGDEFLRQHAGNIMEWLGSPLLRFKLGSLLQLSPEEAMQLSQSVGGDFLQMLRMTEFKQAFDQLSKLGPDTVRVLSFSNDGIEVGVEKSLAGKLYPGVQKGSVVEFEFARGSVVLKGLLTYAEERGIGDSKYLVFAFKAEERISGIFELLKEDLQVIPGQRVEKSFGFNAFTLLNGKLSMDKGSLSMDGAVRLGDGMVLRLEDPAVKLVSSENPFETGTINEMLLGGRIGGISVIVGEEGGIKAFHGGSYLPAVVTASSLGLQLGLLAKPSGGTLTITGESLLAKGISDLSLLNVVYPSGETSTVIYTGGSLQIPMLSYSSGAFVGIQPVETRIVWTSIGRRELYTQVASVSGLLGSVLGGIFAEKLVETVLQSGLTDMQVLDIVNTLAKNAEWLKALSGSGRVEAVRRITDYVKKGETAEEAREKVEKESEEYVRNLWIGINSFLQDIGDPELAAEVVKLLECVSGNLVDEPNATSWLLCFLKSIRTQGGNTKLRDVVENLFKYHESVTQGCTVASSIARGLMKLDQKKLLSLLEETSWYRGWTSFVVSVGENRYINFGRVETAKATLLRMIAGSSEFIVIKINGHDVIRKLNPERKGSYQWMIPEFVGDFGRKGDEIMVEVRPLSRREFIESVVRSLPFSLRLVLESDYEGMLTLMDAVSIPVRVTRFEWSEGNNALEVDLEFRGTHYGEMVPHTLAIAAKGDEVKAVIRFSNTSGTVNSIRLGTLEGHIVINYHDYSYRDFDHDTLPENVVVLIKEKMEEKSWLELELSEEEREMLKELVKANKREEYGNMVRDLVLRKMKNTGEIAGRKMKTDRVRKETPIHNKGERVDIVAESENGKLIVVEVKSTKDPENVWEQYRNGWNQLKVKTEKGGPGYMQLIEEHGLEVFDEVRKDVEAYIIVVVLIDENTGVPHIEITKEVPKD